MRKLVLSIMIVSVALLQTGCDQNTGYQLRRKTYEDMRAEENVQESIQRRSADKKTQQVMREFDGKLRSPADNQSDTLGIIGE